MDSHLHSLFSADSNTRLQELLSQNRPLTLTDHFDIHPAQDVDYRFEPDDYFETLLPLRSDQFLIGIEAGMRQEARDTVYRMMHDYPFDFVLGSVHAPFDKDSPDDFYQDQTFLGMDQLRAQSYYFTEVRRSVEYWGEIDALAHLDYVLRSARAPGRHLLIDECSEQIWAIMKALVEQDIVLEVNTRRFEKPSFEADWRGLLSSYKRAGGQFVTMGSDAHKAAGTYRHFETVKRLIEEYSLRVVYFKNREKIII